VVARAGRPKAELALTDAERSGQARTLPAASSSQAYALWCRIILASADGATNTRIADDLGISMPTMGEWRARFLTSGSAGLADEP
jgi:Homeodomain-like domain